MQSRNTTSKVKKPAPGMSPRPYKLLQYVTDFHFPCSFPFDSPLLGEDPQIPLYWDSLSFPFDSPLLGVGL